jgi:uncharacterized protein (UPF0332 family)
LEATTKEILKGYLEKAERKLEVAGKLFASGNFEDDVSRAYYAVFHATQGLLLTEGQKADTHKGVVTLFSLLFVKTGKFKKDFLKYLTNLKDEREAGDYEILLYTDRETAETAIAEARKFLAESKSYLKKMNLLE